MHLLFCFGSSKCDLSSRKIVYTPATFCELQYVVLQKKECEQQLCSSSREQTVVSVRISWEIEVNGMQLNKETSSTVPETEVISMSVLVNVAIL